MILRQVPLARATERRYSPSVSFEGFTSLDDPGPEEAALTLYEKVERLQDIFIWRGRNPSADNEEYKRLRREVLNSSIAPKLPPLLRRVRDIDAYWPIAKEVSPRYAGRDQFVREAFGPALDALEAEGSPLEDAGQLASVPEIAEAWRKALDRVESDPSGAITAARTLAERVCKHILRELGEEPGNRDELPVLWRRVSEKVELSPEGYDGDTIRIMLGNLSQVASRIASLRSDLGDAHAVDHRAEVRHARLAVNAAATLSIFAMEAFGAQRSEPEDAGFFDFDF